MQPGSCYRCVFALVFLLSFALLAACGQATPPPATPSSAARPVDTPTQASISLPSPTDTALPTATPSPELRPPTDLERLLRFVPDDPAYTRTIYFGDREQVSAAFALPRLDGLEDMRTLEDDERERWNRAMTSVLSSLFSGFPPSEEWRPTFGFDWFQTDRDIMAGERPQEFSVMEGRFDVVAVEAALDALGYEPVQIADRACYRLPDGLSVNPDHPLAHMITSYMSQMCASDDLIVAAFPGDALADVLSAANGDRPSLADDPQCVALAQALAPALGLVLFDGKETFTWAPIRPERDLPADYRAQLAAEPLHRYDRAAVGHRDDGQQRTVFIALAYGDPAAAAMDGPILARRLAGIHREQTGTESFSEYWTVGEPQVHGCPDGAVLTVRLELNEQAPRSLWIHLFMEQNRFFLMGGQE